MILDPLNPINSRQLLGIPRMIWEFGLGADPGHRVQATPLHQHHGVNASAFAVDP